ncbi:MAG: hypothetical protein AB7F50_02055 [Fimbriimonadaceae bacterium]
MNDTKESQVPGSLEGLRKAASWGPGYRGTRVLASEADRTQLIAQLEEAGEGVPSYLAANAIWVDRKAKLFEVGEYPDKGVTVLPTHLEQLAANFDLPVPVLIEHARSPLEIGYLTALEAEGDELFGTIALTEQAHGLIESSGARSLSLGLDSDLSSVREVSLVRSPRIASARLFSSPVQFANEWETEWQSERAQYLAAKHDDWLEGLVAQGKAVPAQLPHARALLGCEEAVLFDGASVPVSRLARNLLEAAPIHSMFRQTVPEKGPSRADLPPEEADFYRRHFPGVSLEEIARRRKDDPAA